MAHRDEEITRLLNGARHGDPAALDRLLPLVYDELRRLADYKMAGERTDHTLQPTALVHEAYVRLLRDENRDWHSRAHFFAAAAEVMRRILVDHARARRTAKRGGHRGRVALDEVVVEFEDRSTDLVELDQALTELAAVNPRQSRIVELRFFGGLSTEETAEVLKISPTTVERGWRTARAWLLREIREAETSDG